MTFFGADVAELRRLGRSLEESSTRLALVVDSINAVLETTEWSGPDADLFRDAWFGQLRAAATAAAGALAQSGKTAIANADAQEVASTDEGAAAGVSAAAGAVGPAGAIAGAAGPASVDEGVASGPIGAARPGAAGDDDDDWSPHVELDDDGNLLLGEFELDGMHITTIDGIDADELAAMERFIERNANNPEMLGQLFANLGSRYTMIIVRDYLAFGDETGAARWRDALAKGSGTWSTEEAKRFSQLVLDVQVVPGGYVRNAPAVLAYLFSGDIPMSGEFAAIVAANYLEDPRINGLSELKHAVLLTLAKDPVATTAYFTDPEHGVDRRLLWFKRTDWTETGFDVPAALMLATQQTKDGDPITLGGTAAERYQAAALFAKLVRDLTENPDFYPENLCEDAGMDLAEAIGYNWVGIQESLADNHYEKLAERRDYVEGYDALSGARVYAPIVHELHLEWLIGAVGSTEMGAAVLDGTMANYRTGLLAWGLNTEGMSYDQIMSMTSRIQQAQELIDRSVNAQALDTAMRADQQTRQDVSTALLTVGTVLAPLTGGGSAVLGQMGAFYVNGVVTTSVNESLGSWFATETAAAGVKLEGNKAGQKEFSDMTTTAVVAEFLSVRVDDLPEPGDYATTSDYTKAMERWNEQNLPKVVERAGGKDVGMEGFTLDNILSNYDPRPRTTEKPQ